MLIFGERGHFVVQHPSPQTEVDHAHMHSVGNQLDHAQMYNTASQQDQDNIGDSSSPTEEPPSSSIARAITRGMSTSNHAPIRGSPSTAGTTAETSNPGSTNQTTESTSNRGSTTNHSESTPYQDGTSEQHVRTNKAYLSIQSINVCGLKGKLKIPEFRENLKLFDISLLCETKLDDADIELIQESISDLNLKAVFKNRKTVTAWRSGGLCIIYSEQLEKYLTHINSKCKLVQWLKINKTLIGTDKDLMIGNTYLPPERSNYNNATAYQELQNELLKFKNNHFYIAGDLNSHSGTIRDYIEKEDFMPEQLNFDSEVQDYLNNISWLQNNNISLNRENSSHKRPDERGKQLIDFCKSNNMFICNGRLDTDVNGKATTTDGSVIDYLLASPLILCKTKLFHVHDFDAIYSDKHCRVSWRLICQEPFQTSIKAKQKSFITIKKTHRNMWTSDKAVAFSNQINTNEVNSIRSSLMNEDANINCTLDKIQKLFKNTANAVLGHERIYKIDANAKRKPIKFNRQTLNARNKYYKARRQNDGSQIKKDDLNAKSKAYKKAVAKAQALHRKKVIKKIRNAKTRNPKFYWSVLNRQFNSKTNRSNDAMSGIDFFNGFKTLSGSNNQGEFIPENEDSSGENQIYIELANKILNSKITAEEIFLRVKELKNGKACGTDDILNEFIKSTFNEMKLVYVDLFNRILNTGQIPESWTIGMIMPIYKNKGDKADFDNYRGITILSCLGKLFTSVINDRLDRYANEVNLINENQTGFRKNYSTLDHIFLLHNIIDIFINKNEQKLYCAFVDYKKAFDTVWRSALWHKMMKSGITGKLSNIIVNMYDNIKSCVSVNGELSEYFLTLNGVRQGENLSPFLFALFINDIEESLIQYGCDPIKILDSNQQTFLKLLIILYADDTVLFANSKENLQKCLNGLKHYCDKWKLEINASKTKIIIFSKGKPQLQNHNFKIGDEIIEVVKDFKYLGVTFSCNGGFVNNIKELKKQGNRAIFGLIKKAREGHLPIDIQFDLFDKQILPKLLYGCEIWGYRNLNTLEKLHLKFCKIVLKLKKSTPDIMVYGETGRCDLEYYASKRIINFWGTIACGKKSKLSYIIYNLCKQRYMRDIRSAPEWFVNLANMLNRFDINFIPNQEAIIKEVVKKCTLT